MSMPVDPPRGPRPVRRTRRTAERSEAAPEAAQETASANLPVPVEPARPIPGGAARAGGDAAIHAQVIGERRGLRAGPTIHDEARSSYNRVEWSGSKDRRAPKGRKAKTEV
jgi:hypothetical protein